ncbi:hypothetical protein QWY93_10380 [Echinicola jeungdonensis]|uniref:Uncharacterized protein n=1 Tax=Echinicola jeungdonensis TaxID=709343 RepID=A0ABV5J944_9BACT|nr:hypothetical protein [Echinicola jeungdonensis]MDN3669730.1 hypothetical protein [Echinicola jeungdonensis]
MIKRILVIVLVIILGLAGYLFYRSSFFTRQLDAADLVGSDAIFVFETSEPVNVWNQLVSQPIWGRLSDVPSLKGVEKQLGALDSLTGASGELENALSGHQFIVSLHPTAKSEFDFLFLVGFKNQKHTAFLKSVQPKSQGNGQINSRNYSGETIFEYQDKDQQTALSYALLGNVLVASYNSFLIEEAVRHVKSEKINSFKDTYKELYNSSSVPKDKLGVFRMGSKGVAAFVQGITRENDLEFVQDFSQHNMAANLDLKFAKNKVFLDGFTFYLDGEPMDFTTSESGGGSLFSNYISNRTALYYQYNVADPSQVKAIYNHAFEQKNTLKGEIEKHVLNKGFMKNLTGEIGYLTLEGMPNMEADKILIMKSVNLKEQINTLKAFSLEMNQGDSSRVISDYYKDNEVFMINLPEFPGHLFEGQFIGFPRTFVTGYEDMLVMSNNIKAIKVFLDDVYNDNTWGRSLDQRRFLDGISKNAGFNFIINIPRFWNTILQVTTPEWQALLQKYAPQLKSIDLVALQLSEINDHQYMNLELGYNLDPIKSVQDILLAKSMSIHFGESLTYGPQAIENFNDKSTDFLVQDEMNQIHFFNDEGERIFDKGLNSPIVGDVYQIDYYKNGKLQVLFATEKAIYAFDRLGEALPGYPIRLPEGEKLTHMSLVDYNNTRDYRYFVALSNGNLYIFDKRGNNLDGWTPRKTSGRLAAKPAHHRLSGIGDFMIALNENGELYLMNRRGQLQTGGPVNLGEGISTDYVLIQRGDEGETQLATISEEGEVVKVNFRGELTYRNQLVRPDKNTHFSLVKDQSEDQYLYVVHEYNKVSVLNAEQEELFEKNMVSDDLEFQFFSFGSDKNIFVIIDKVQEFIYLYNLEGELLNTRPISGKNKLEVKYSGSKNEYSIYAVNQNQFAAYKMPL